MKLIELLHPELFLEPYIPMKAPTDNRWVCHYCMRETVRGKLFLAMKAAIDEKDIGKFRETLDEMDSWEEQTVWRMMTHYRRRIWREMMSER